MFQQVKVGKLHLIKREADEYRTACGILLSWQHMATPADEIWLGPDKCKRCLSVLESGGLGVVVVGA